VPEIARRVGFDDGERYVNISRRALLAARLPPSCGRGTT
jgi:hypothetical protein